MADKRVTLQIDTELNDSKIKTLDQELNRLKQQQLQLKIDANVAELQKAEERIKNLKIFLDTANTGNVNFHIDDSDIIKAEKELEALQSKHLNLQIAVADGELQQAKAEEEALNGSAQFSIDVDDASAQGAMQNIQDGINQAKQGLGELASGFGEVLSAAGSADQNQAFLQIGFDKAGSKNAIADAKEAQGKIQDIVATAPGDDIAMNSILSSAVAKDVKLMDKDMQGFANSVSDYFAGAEVNGKHAAEAIQDVRSYITSGNVAELQTTGIFDDKQLEELKDIDSVSDRVAKFQEMVGKSSYAGLGTADTLNNKMAEFDGMVAKSATSLGSFFTDATKGAADLFLSFNDMTGGLAGMALVAVQQFGPGLFSVVQGLLVMVPGLKALGGLSGIWGALSTGATGFAGALTGVTIAGAPLWAVIAAIVALGVAVYEVGKYFGWWKDLPSMFGALKAGVMELWNAFVSNEYVQQAIQLITQGLNDAWNAIVQFGQALMTALSGEGGAGSFDILQQDIQNLNTILSIVGPLVIAAINGIITYFRILYTAGQQIWTALSMVISYAMANIRGIIVAATGIWSGLQSAWRTLQSTASSVFGAINGIVSSAGGVWQGFQSTVMGAIQPIIDKINQLKDAAAGITSLGGLMSGGIETPSVSGGGGYGSGPTTVSQGNTIIFNMYGDIRDEKTLDDTIDAINSRIQFEALASGTTTTNNGGGV